MDCDGFIDINSNRNLRERINIFLNIFERNPDQVAFLDFVLLTKSLKDISDISEEYFKILLDLSTKDFSSEQEKLFTYIKEVLKEISIHKVYSALCKSGYSHLFSLFVFHKYRYSLSAPDKVPVPFSKYANERYRFIKKCVDNNTFNGDVKQHLNALERKAVNRFCGERAQEECQKYLEEKVIIDLHLIQLYGATDFDKRIEILQNMKETSTEGLDRTSLELTYHSKMAVTYAKLGLGTQAEENVRQTMDICERCVPCFATIMALNDVLYTFQELCFVHRTPELLEMSLNHGQLFCHLLCCEDEIDINQWKRIILLFMVMSRLNISHEFKAGDINEVTEDDKQHARALIAEVLNVSKDIEVRRKMVLHLCQARLHEQTDRNVAMAYVKMAYNLSNDGCLRNSEKINIHDYMFSLQC